MTKNFCFQCGECCKSLYDGMRVSGLEMKAIRKATGYFLYGEFIGQKDRVTGDKAYKLHGKECPFLAPNNVCTIYNVRPSQCRAFHCGRLEPDDLILHDMNKIWDLMTQNPEYAEYRRIIGEDAMQWGRAHGYSWRCIE